MNLTGVSVDCRPLADLLLQLFNLVVVLQDCVVRPSKAYIGTCSEKQTSQFYEVPPVRVLDGICFLKSTARLLSFPTEVSGDSDGRF